MKDRDITPKEREHLSRLRTRPAVYFGKRASISDLELYWYGMYSILLYHKLTSEICIIPEGFTDYLAEKYSVSASVNWAGIIRSVSTDEYTAFEKFWELLNEYLELNGYAPIEKIDMNYMESVQKDGIDDIFYPDIPKVAESYMKTFNSEPWNDTWDKETAVMRIRELFNSARPYCRCIWNDGCIIGALMGRYETYFDGEVFQLVELWVQPEYQGNGYAKQLLETLKSDLKEWGVKRIYLLTMHCDLTEGFYRHNGFVTDKGMCVMNLDL